MWLVSTILGNVALEMDKQDNSVSEGDKHHGEMEQERGHGAGCAYGACAVCAVFNGDHGQWRGTASP